MKRSSRPAKGVDPDNPPLTRAALARFRPSREVVPRIVESYLKRKGRPPVGETSKVQVTLRLDPAVIAHFKARGPGWQTRINEVLVKSIRGKNPSRRKSDR